MILCTTPDLTDYLDELKKITEKRVFVSPIRSMTYKELKNIEILLSYGNYEDQLYIEDLELLENLKWIQILSSGIDQLPLDYLQEKGIIITTVKGIHSIPISEYVLGVLLYFEKKIKLFEEEKRNKNWNEEIILSELEGKTLGILGTGYIGKAIAKKAKAFGMRTIGVNRSGRNVEHFDSINKIHTLKSVVKVCDYICSVLPSTEETKYIINEEVIQAMKSKVGFINVGRGDVIEEKTFVEALSNGKIKWAALDVFEEEPLSSNHVFWDIENLLITTHASARTKKYLHRSLEIFKKNFLYFKKNELNNMINVVMNRE